MGKTCQICGKASGMYPLCKTHLTMKAEGKVEKCQKCGIWHETKEPCNCSPCIKKEEKWTKAYYEEKAKQREDEKQDEQIEQESQPQNIIIDKGIRCITCGYETDGKLFCKKCYAQYSGKEILIKIKNCREIVPLDDFYEGYYECDDGHVVKSMAERDIDNYLFEKNIKHGYETPLLLPDEKGNKITLHPDFCVFDDERNPIYYIEYWGYDDNNRDYTKTKKFKLPLYEKAGITLVNINAKTDLRNLKTNLKYKLENFKKGKINFLNE